MNPEPNIDKYAVPGALGETFENGDVRCTACAHRCLIHPGRRGICGVRFNEGGVLKVPSGYAAGVQIDPIEKKPFSHFLPGSEVLTFGMLGCNFHCSFCQNWYSSQALRDPCAHESTETIRPLSADKLVNLAISNHAVSIASSYNEPMITSEWGVEVFKLAKEHGLMTTFVSNGYGTPEVLNFIRPWLDSLKIDLKSMRDSQYRKMGGTLQPVIDTIKQASDLGFWVEVVTLVIPGFNDSVEELWDTSRFIASVSPDIPWHVTAYHPDYQMVDAPPTPPDTLQKAAEIGQEAGLRYVYAGNIPGRVGSLENTYCPKCAHQLITRTGFRVKEMLITEEGKCPNCGEKIAGVWITKS